MRSRCPCLWAGQGWRSWVLGAQWRGPATYRQENLALGATWHLPKALPQAAASSPGSSMTWAWLGHILGMSWACLGHVLHGEVGFGGSQELRWQCGGFWVKTKDAR